MTLVLVSLVSSSGWGLTLDDLVIRAGLYYEKFTATPFTGEVNEGLARGSIKNGKNEGSWEYYSSNGQLEATLSYKNGKREGSFEDYWPDGNLFRRGSYKNDRKEGYWEWYRQDGVLMSSPNGLTGTYKNGMKVSD